MNDLISTLLDCPNLSLRLLDSKTGRSVRTVNNEQLHQIYATQQIHKNRHLVYQRKALKLQNMVKTINY
ncbi:hypothetical protein MNBD_GAMMA11-318 [hydrothermal vent metagenome]|uniref:Uncharacterized protein n=1 Tax=hydrothermal vent metagenome TaxID=652676 RepID=A0A3B0XKM1_9ZZZZ